MMSKLPYSVMLQKMAEWTSTTDRVSLSDELHTFIRFSVVMLLTGANDSGICKQRGGGGGTGRQDGAPRWGAKMGRQGGVLRNQPAVNTVKKSRSRRACPPQESLRDGDKTEPN